MYKPSSCFGKQFCIYYYNVRNCTHQYKLYYYFLYGCTVFHSPNELNHTGTELAYKARICYVNTFCYWLN